MLHGRTVRLCRVETKQEVFTRVAILGSFLQYVIVMVILAAVGVGGVFAGKKLRERKDAKMAAEAAEDKQ